MKRGLSLIIAVVLLSACILSGCGNGGGTSGGAGGSTGGSTGGGTSTSTGGGTAEPAPPAQGDTEFTFVLAYDITNMDPQNCNSTWDSMVILNTHDPLVRMDPQGEIYPGLAKEWKVSDDGLEYTFYLHEGVKYQNGDELTAADVKFSLDRGTQAPASLRMTGWIDSVEVVNDYEVKVHAKYPCMGALKFLAQGNNCIISEKILTEKGEDEYKNNPCGTGPFMVSDWKLGDRMVLTANPDYYQGKAAIDTLTIKTIKESTTAVIALENGEVDAVLDVPELSKADIEKNDKLEFLEAPGAAYWALVFNNRMAPFDNKLVRKAINMAIDRQEVINVALDGKGVVTDIAINPKSTGFIGDVKRDELDIEKAKALLTEAGFPNGFSSSIYVREDFTQKIGQVLQQQLAKIGVTVEVVVMERSALLADVQAGKLSMCTMGTTDLILDSELPLSALDSKYIGATNYPFFANDEYDALNAELIVTTDMQKRLDITRQMLLIEKEEVPRAPLYFQVNNIAYNKEFKNIAVYPTSLYYFYPITK